MNLEGQIVKLRAIEEQDLDLLLEMINDAEIEGLTVGYSLPVSRQQQEAWIRENQNDQNSIRFIIEAAADGAVGFANLIDIDWKNRSAVHNIKIANRKLRHRGICYDTVRTIMKYAFEELQLHRLESSIIASNEAPAKLLCEKLGWSEEGVKRQALFKRGSYHDVKIMGIVAEDYLKLE